MSKKGDNWWSVAGVVVMAVMLPVLLRGVNKLQRYLAGAQGRLAAVGVETGRVLGEFKPGYGEEARDEILNTIQAVGAGGMLSRLGGERIAVTGEGTWVKAIGTTDGKGYQVLLVNYDPKAIHSEVVPVSFMQIKAGSFIVRQSFLDGGSSQQEASMAGGIWQKEVPMTPNSAVLLELTPKL